MAVLEILAYPNPFLRKVAQKVTQFDDSLKQIVANMSETMVKSDGLGLAATQVGLDMQLFILSPLAFKEKDEELQPGEVDLVFINPEIVEQSKEEYLSSEGCLSFPDVYINVSRPQWVVVKALDINGTPFEIKGEQLGARAMLHEMDHLSGKVMIDHVSYFNRQRALNKHQKVQKILAEEKAKNNGKMAGKKK